MLSAGDDGYGGSSNDTAEIYEPPYLFRGRGRRSSLPPARSRYDDTFTVETSGGASKAVLVAPGAVTHANDMSQRYVPLDVDRERRGDADRRRSGIPGARSARPTTCCSC